MTMRRLIITITALSLLGGTALAQIMSNGSGASASGPAVAPDRRAPGDAPVGHRQPRVTSAVTEDRNPAKLDAEEAALDRKIKSICRGC
jgi:hypothetical protein